MTARFAGDVRLNKMAKKDYSLVPSADGGGDLYVLDTPMMNETEKPLVYPFGFEPTLHRHRMDIPGKLKMGNNIFVGAMADIFGAISFYHRNGRMSTIYWGMGNFFLAKATLYLLLK